MFSRYLSNFNTDSMPHEFTEYLVIGSGIAGLYTALKASKSNDVVLVTKKKVEDSNTEHAQGGIAAAIDQQDSPLFHYEDTIKAGAGLCDPEAVKILVSEGPDRVKELMELGTNFDKIGNVLALTREGAHSHSRILHARGDATGEEIRRALGKQIREENKVRIFEDSFVVDILVHKGRCVGALVIDQDGSKKVFWSRVTVLATGGIGQLYKNTTNPDVATGDGIAIAYRAGVEVMDMEFIQFHPTALSKPGVPRFLISEAVRGEGALLRNVAGERFMPHYHYLSELAPRDVVSRAIVNETEKNGDDNVYLDLTPLGESKVRKRFPNITRTCAHYGVDIKENLIPVSPAAHYMMGGVRTNLTGETNIKGLYACGETACLAVHGANRLASNSLLDGIVYGERIVQASKTYLATIPPKMATLSISNTINKSYPAGEDIEQIKGILKEIMWQNVGIIRNRQQLQKAIEDIKNLVNKVDISNDSIENLELINQLQVAFLVAKSALMRTESRGGHYREDYPNTNDLLWKRHIILGK